MLQQKGTSKFLRFCMINNKQFVAVKIKYPKPLLEPIISAEIVHIKAIPTPTLSPETIGGTAEGKITCVSTVLSSAPSVCADSIKTLSVLLTPSIV